jgi:receptor protein-tyrosine kinase/non-specific protein-tyrosine kinase
MSRIEKALEKANQMRYGGEHIVDPPLGDISHPPTPDFSASGVAVRTDNPYLVVINDPSSRAAEEYRKLKSMVVKHTKKGTGLLNTIMVTSTIAEEGKSITSLNLAVSLAQEYDKTVLLVDADLRRPSINRYLGIEPAIGLSDVLSGEVDLSQALVKTGIGNLVVLSAGTKVSDPVELLHSNRMVSFVKELKNRYSDRYIIFDTPPVLPFAEAHAIGSIVDAVVFVVRVGRAQLTSVKQALETLKESNIIGITYNCAETGFSSSDYSYDY